MPSPFKKSQKMMIWKSEKVNYFLREFFSLSHIINSNSNIEKYLKTEKIN